MTSPIRRSRAALYLRVSTQEQADGGTSIETQRVFLRALADLKGWEVHAEYVDAGFSGTSATRPEFTRMMGEARQGQFDVVAVTKLDRFMRDARLLLNTIEELDHVGVAFVAANDGIDTSDPVGGRFVLTVLGAVAQLERDRILERTEGGRLATAKKGGLLGGFVPYGYDYVAKSDHRLAHYRINEAEAAVVREVYRWLIEEGLSCRAIAERLTERIVPTKKGRHLWHPSVVNQMLRDETYAGTAYYGRRESVEPQRRRVELRPGKGRKSSRRLKPRQQWIPIAVPPIVDREVWGSAQQQLAANSRFSPRNNKRWFPLRGLVHCGTCDAGYVGQATHKRGRSYRYYGCNGRRRLPGESRPACAGPYVRAEPLENVVWDAVTDILRAPEALAQEFQRQADRGYSPDGADAERRKLRTELERLAKREDRLLDLYADETFDREALKTKLDEIVAQRRAIDDRARALDNRQARTEQNARALRNLEAFRATVAAGIDRLSPEERQEVLRLVVDRVVVVSKQLARIELAIPLVDPDGGSGLRPSRPPPSPPETQAGAWPWSARRCPDRRHLHAGTRLFPRRCRAVAPSIPYHVASAARSLANRRALTSDPGQRCHDPLKSGHFRHPRSDRPAPRPASARRDRVPGNPHRGHRR